VSCGGAQRRSSPLLHAGFGNINARQGAAISAIIAALAFVLLSSGCRVAPVGPGSPPNNPPIAIDDSATTVRSAPVTIGVLANDTDPDGDALTLTSVTQGANGTVTMNPDGTVRYVPNGGFIGTDTFTYSVSDGRGGSATATVQVRVVNRPPVADDDSATTTQGTVVSIAVLANDSDPDSDALTVTSVTQGTGGTVVVEPDGTVRYTPAPNFIGADAFTYTLSDGRRGVGETRTFRSGLFNVVCRRG